MSQLVGSRRPSARYDVERRARREGQHLLRLSLPLPLHWQLRVGMPESIGDSHRVTVPPPIKVILLGSSNCGKTSLRSRFIHNTFSRNYRASVGADFETVHIDHQGQRLQLSVWDTAGQERFKALSAPFYRGSDAVLLCYSATDAKSLQALRSWYDEFVEKCPVPEEDRWRFCFVGLRLKDDMPAADGASSSDAEVLFRELLPTSSTRTSMAKSDAVAEATVERATIQVAKPISRSKTHQSFRTTHSIYHTPDSSLSSSTIKAPGSHHRPDEPHQCQDDFDPMIASSPPPLPAGFPSARYETPLSDLLPPPSPPKLPQEPIPNGHIHPVKGERVRINTRDFEKDGIKHFATSAKEDRGINEVFEYIVERVVWKRALIEEEQREDEMVRRERQEAIQLHDDKNKSWRSRCC